MLWTSVGFAAWHLLAAASLQNTKRRRTQAGMVQCGRLFDREEFEEHSAVHNTGYDFSSKTAPEAESGLLRRAGEEEQGAVPKVPRRMISFITAP